MNDIQSFLKIAGCNLLGNGTNINGK